MLRAERLARPEGLRLLKNLVFGPPPVEASVAEVTTEVLVVTATGDDVHPVDVAEENRGGPSRTPSSPSCPVRRRSGTRAASCGR